MPAVMEKKREPLWMVFEVEVPEGGYVHCKFDRCGHKRLGRIVEGISEYLCRNCSTSDRKVIIRAIAVKPKQAGS